MPGVENLDDLLAEVENAMNGEENAGSDESMSSPKSKYVVVTAAAAEGSDQEKGEVEMIERRDSKPSHTSSRRNSAFVLPPEFKRGGRDDTPAGRASSAFLGPETNLTEVDSDEESDAGGENKGLDRCLARYHIKARKLRIVTKNPWFDQFIIMVILIAGVLVGVQTYPLHPNTESNLEIVDAIILSIFTLEVVLKIIAAGRRPWVYFADNWNKFDFFIVIAAFTPGISSQATMLRLLRLLRVLKLVKALPQLQIIVTSLLASFSSLGYIAMLMTMLFYLFAILAVMLFGKNDPHHFKTLHISFLSLWRSATGEDWTDLMYLGMYGCDPPMEGGVATGGGFYDDDLFRHLCTESSGAYAVSAIYHIVFHIFAGLVLLNLMVGVIIGSIFEAKAGLNGDKLIVVIQRAKDLPRADLIGSSDPFCKITVGGRFAKVVKKTRVVKNNLNPVWEQEFTIELKDIRKETVKFEVFDWDLCGGDDLLGSFRLKFTNLRWNKPVNFELELDEADTGTLFVQLKKVAGPNHILLESEKDKWDHLQDKYFVACELVAECKEMLQDRKRRKELEKKRSKNKIRWDKIRAKGKMASFMAKVSDVATTKADTKMSKDDIQSLYGSNKVFDFRNRTMKH